MTHLTDTEAYDAYEAAILEAQEDEKAQFDEMARYEAIGILNQYLYRVTGYGAHEQAVLVVRSPYVPGEWNALWYVPGKEEPVVYRGQTWRSALDLAMVAVLPDYELEALMCAWFESDCEKTLWQIMKEDLEDGTRSSP